MINPYHLQVASFILINILLGVSIYITLATGQLSLGSAGFMSIGAFTSALLTSKLGLPIPVGILAGSFLAALTGILIGIPTLRLHGVYLAIATLGFGEVVRVLFVNWESLTNGAVGIAGIPHLGRTILARLQKAGFSPEMVGLKNNEFISLTVFSILLLITILVILFFARLDRSRIGRAFHSIRMDEKAAEAMGINTTYYKILTFSQGAFLAGFSGALFAHVTGYISPADFTYHRAVEILVFAVFGGSEVLWGPIFGATFLTITPELLRSLSEYRYMFYGAFLVLMMIFRPQGLIDANLINRIMREKAGETMLLELKGVSKVFGGLAALDQISFCLQEGEILGLIGPNGAGKTTLFNVVTSFLYPTSGEIFFADERIDGLKTHKITQKGINRTFQNIRLFDQMTVEENVMVGRHCRSRAGVFESVFRTPGQKEEENLIREKTNDLLELVGLTGYNTFPAMSLPYGLQRRVEIARALAGQPRLILLDEPVAGMNDSETEEMALLIKKILGLGITVLLIEHDMSMVMKVCDRLVVLNFGQKIAEGTPQEIQSNPEVIEAYLGREEEE